MVNIKADLDEDERKQCIEEAIKLQKLDHENIIKVIEHDGDNMTDNFVRIVLEYAPEGDLMSYINTRKKENLPIEPKKLLSWYK